MGAQSILDILLRTKTDSTGVKQAQGALKGFNKTIQDLTGFNLASAATFAAVGYAVKKVVTDTVAYAKSVRELAQVTNVSTEEASKFIQIADDFGITTEQVQTALKMAVQNGFNPSIEAIADLSDQYLSLTTAEARANLLQPIFGKQWANMVPILSQGRDKILEMSDALEGSALVLDQKAVQAARNFEIKLDNLQDSAKAAGITVGNVLIPAITDFFDIIARGSTTTYDFTKGAMTALNQALEDGRITTEQYSAIWKTFQTDTSAAEGIFRYLTGTVKEGADELERAAQATEDLKNREINGKDVMGEYTKQLLYNQAAAGLDADSSLALASAMGLVDQTTLAALQAQRKIREEFDNGIISAEQYAGDVAAINSAIAALQSKHITITVEHIEWYTRLGVASSRNMSGTQQGADITRAEGGPVAAGAGYIVGEEGPEYFRPTQSGEIVPSGQGGGGTTYFYAPVTFEVKDGQTFEGLMAELAAKRG